MPKQTFFNLPEDKQKKLMEAARVEFSRAPLHEASISNIIKKCGVSRGSFYQYFEDKDDAFYYLLKQYTNERQERLMLLLDEHNGNLFEAMTIMFQQTLDRFEKEENRSYFKHVFLNMNHKIQNTMASGEKEKDFPDHLSVIQEHVDADLLQADSEKEIRHTIHLVRLLMFHTLVRHFSKGWTKEEAFETFTLELNLMRKGLEMKE
ncbi:TetR/AcrR family transcriptional regulator [Halobacillus salinus]|uniref:TetR/AcrR family transcriptional regulator n=1 Tax=Halobacillus salinus TaxID=192814 RepID=A0A4Z0GYZ3_9BACI|nr:TetR family transcriptional regulator [Halobacillus salinus]TGB02414.1 TetR/AcrR family transcriptional regulator [Halobacillus salinus]